MFENLPRDIQEKIYDNSEVLERIKLNIALPKDLKFTHKKNEKTLGILYKVINNNKLKKLSISMRNFFTSINENDPTLINIIEKFPEIKNYFYDKKLLGNIESLTYDDIIYLIRTASITNFMKFKNHSCFNDPEKLQEILRLCLFFNNELFEYIAKEKIYNIEVIREQLKYAFYDVKKVKMLLNYYLFSNEELNKYYIECIEDIRIESACLIEQYIKTKYVF